MTTHTPGPLCVKGQNSSIFFPQFRHLYSIFSIRIAPKENMSNTVLDGIAENCTEEDANHFVKCWNACEGINPDAVQDLLERLQRTLRYLADLNGSQWITDNSPGGIDMRQRAKALQRLLYETIAKATK
jgi:hypothetical protein